jgi:hypothetical protein
MHLKVKTFCHGRTIPRFRKSIVSGDAAIAQNDPFGTSLPSVQNDPFGTSLLSARNEPFGTSLLSVQNEPHDPPAIVCNDPPATVHNDPPVIVRNDPPAVCDDPQGHIAGKWMATLHVLYIYYSLSCAYGGYR